MQDRVGREMRVGCLTHRKPAGLPSPEFKLDYFPQIPKDTETKSLSHLNEIKSP